MQNLSSLMSKTLAQNDVKHISEMASSSCLASFASKMITSSLHKNAVYESISETSADIDDVKRRLTVLRNATDLNQSYMQTQHVIALDKDENMTDFIFVMDFISACDEIAKVYMSDIKNADDWYAKQISEKVQSAENFIDQLAAQISPMSDRVQIELQMDSAIFDTNKSLATIIKQNSEFKRFKKCVKKRHNFTNQSLNIRSLSMIILSKAKELLTIL